MLLGFGYLYKFVMYYFFLLFFEKAEHNRLKKARLPKLCNIIFWFLLKIGSFRSIDQQINLVSSYKLRLLHGDFSIYRLTVG